MSDDHEFWKYVWGALLVPITWFWHRINRIETNGNETRITLAERHYTKLEVHDLVDRAVKPVHDKLDEIRGDIKYLVREKNGKDS